ncbi:CDP-alcohol phosphatidyltransferase family protein [Harryflintia acetispora]|uniref:CDP-diacylglycerol--glycerol-3-phosphate 3-phosphatidyltransferase n=1 Tax=Harryflintia acetispora TaxID=1849041 RepID=A0A9X8UHA1_9FIRM|nr:CDP-alcohol phosphatidyltransferase family protein [Harryflintia acetispora]TCL41082.1 cardiolipin synthase [Harryflintia acetispora]
MRGPYSQLKSIPNILSLVRILLIPFFLWAFLWKRSYLLSSGLLIVSGLSDLCDGYIARRFNMVTELGKVLDPVADKLTQLAILFCLSLRYPVFLAALAVFAVKELLMLTGGILLFRKRIHPGSAKWFGKLATFFFYLSTIVIVLIPTLDERVVNTVVLLNILLLLFALARYIPIFFSLKKGGGND